MNKIADHEFHIISVTLHFHHCKLTAYKPYRHVPQAIFIFDIQLTHVFAAFMSFDMPVIMYQKRLWLRFNTNYIRKSGYQSVVNLVALVFATWNVLTALVCKEMLGDQSE